MLILQFFSLRWRSRELMKPLTVVGSYIHCHLFVTNKQNHIYKCSACLGVWILGSELHFWTKETPEKPSCRFGCFSWCSDFDSLAGNDSTFTSLNALVGPLIKSKLDISANSGSSKLISSRFKSLKKDLIHSCSVWIRWDRSRSIQSLIWFSAS